MLYTYPFCFVFGILYLMIITYFGKQFFKIQQGEMVVAFNPVSKGSKTGISAKFGADIAFVTANNPDYNGVEQLSHGERVPFLINGPGDYDVKEIFVKGSMSSVELAGKKYINTVYSLAVDSINIAFLGALGEEDLSKEAREAVDGPDILFVPIGGDGVLDPAHAQKIAVQFEPKIIIPTHWEGVGSKDALKIFLKEAGAEGVKPVDKLTIKRKDIESKESEVVVLVSSN